LGSIFVGMAAAGGGVALLIKRFAEENPVTPSTQRAREAGQRWQAEQDEEERLREEGR
jgi:hypothetical protein